MTPSNSSAISASHVARRAIFWTISAVFLALAIGANDGRYSGVGMAWLSISIASAIAGVFAPSLLPQLPDTRRALNYALGAGIVIFAALSLVPPKSAHFWPSFAGCLALSALCAAILVRLSHWPLLGRTLLPAFLVIQTIVGVSTVSGGHDAERNSPRFPFQVRNDVQVFAREAARLLTEGKNPYSVRMPNVMGADLPFYAAGATGKDGKLPFGYPYLPLSALFSLPFYWLGDFRYAHVFALIGAACFLAYARPSSTSKLAATLFLLFPSTTFVLLMSWIEPVVLFFLGATVFCYFRAPKWLFLALGCLLASKQYAFFVLALLPLLVPEKQQWRALLWKSVGVALLISLPMALWDVAGFYRSVVEIQFKQPFRADSLSYLVTVLRAGGPQLSPLCGFAALFAGLFLAAKRAPRDAAHWCSASAVAYLGFFALNKQAFANYYFWPFGLLVAAVAVALPSEPDLKAESIPVD